MSALAIRCGCDPREVAGWVCNGQGRRSSWVNELRELTASYESLKLLLPTSFASTRFALWGARRRNNYTAERTHP